ncbi:hypothetical protein ACFLW8_01290 [Chloroflexota bacterium]
MSSFGNRIKKLEQRTGIGEERVFLPVATKELNMEQAEAEVEATVAEYKATHPGYKDIFILHVSKRCKEMLDRVQDRTKKLPRWGE